MIGAPSFAVPNRAMPEVVSHYVDGIEGQGQRTGPLLEVREVDAVSGG